MQTEIGTPFTVSYVLVDPETSNECSFSGWPDFVIAKPSVRAGLLLIALGEVESQRNDATAQLGIYAIGEFQKQNTRNPLTCVAIYKNKSASIYLASLTRDPSHKTIGTVSFQRKIFNCLHMYLLELSYLQRPPRTCPLVLHARIPLMPDLSHMLVL